MNHVVHEKTFIENSSWDLVAFLRRYLCRAPVLSNIISHKLPKIKLYVYLLACSNIRIGRSYLVGILLHKTLSLL